MSAHGGVVVKPTLIIQQTLRVLFSLSQCVDGSCLQVYGPHMVQIRARGTTSRSRGDLAGPQCPQINVVSMVHNKRNGASTQHRRHSDTVTPAGRSSGATRKDGRPHRRPWYYCRRSPRL